MYDHSYNTYTLGAMMRRSDFRGVLKGTADVFRAKTISAAVTSATTLFGGKNPIEVFHLRNKAAYRAASLEDDLVVRKLSRNLVRFVPSHSRGRDFIVSNLRHFLKEGVPYSVYRLDVSAFYESFSHKQVVEVTSALNGLSPLSKAHLHSLLKGFSASGGKGLPRGMAVSAVLSDLLMKDFDLLIAALPGVYFYARYVDDIIILTNVSLQQSKLLSYVANKLPPGLLLNSKKFKFAVVPDKVKPVDGSPVRICAFDYLGYDFIISEPTKEKREKLRDRHVQVEISRAKLDKLKLRIARAFNDFRKTGDATLLMDRVRFLTSNFGVADKHSGKKRLAGIYYSYPQISADASALRELDTFLRAAVFGKPTRLFKVTSAMLSSWQKRSLLGCSFKRGHETRNYAYFSAVKIGQMQECWLYE